MRIFNKLRRGTRKGTTDSKNPNSQSTADSTMTSTTTSTSPTSVTTPPPSAPSTSPDIKAPALSSPKTLRCLKKPEAYRREVKTLFTAPAPFQPLEMSQLLREDAEHISALAQRLNHLHQTIEHDLALLEAPPSSARKKSTSQPGEGWRRLNRKIRQELEPDLQRLSYDERLAILAILAEFVSLPAMQIATHELTAQQQRAHQGWSQVKLGFRLTQVYKESKKETKQSTTTVPSTVSTLSTTASLDHKVESSTTPFDAAKAFEDALLAHDQRSGWAKLVSPLVDSDTPETKESKETKETKKTEGAKDSKDTLEQQPVEADKDRTTSPESERLRVQLKVWLKLKAPVGEVQQRLAAIRDYCLLANRLSECTTHLMHEMALARQVLTEFKTTPLKDHPPLIVAVCQLASAQDARLTQQLLAIFIQSIREAPLLEIPLLEGLALLLHQARPAHIPLGDLRTVLELLVERSATLGSDLAETRLLSLFQAFGAVLAAMALVSQERAVQQAVWQEEKQTRKAQEAKEEKAVPPTNFLSRAKRWVGQQQETLMEKIDGPTDHSGLAILGQEDYESLCLKLNKNVMGALSSRFDLSQLQLQQPNLTFALALMHEALLRLAHRDTPRSQQLLAGAKAFFNLLESAKDTITEFSLSALWDTGNQLLEFINMTPLGGKLKKFLGMEDPQPQLWFEHYLLLKTLVMNGQLQAVEELLIRDLEAKTDAQGLWSWDYYLTQGVLQLLHFIAQTHPEESTRQNALSLLDRVLNQPTLWQWPGDKAFVALQAAWQTSLVPIIRLDGSLTLSQRLNPSVQQQSQAVSQRLVRQARRNCQEQDLSYQLYDYYLGQVRQAQADTAWLQDERRYVPALAKSRIDAEDETAELFLPTFHNFLQLPLISDSKTHTTEEKKTDKPQPSTLLILGDAGVGKSTLIRRAHVQACVRYFGRQLEITPPPVSLYVYLNQSPVNHPIESFLQAQGFTEPQIKTLKEKNSLLVYFDGYDEWSSGQHNPPLFGPKSAGEWMSTRCRVVITCRTQYLQGMPRYQELFIPPKSPSGGGYHQELATETFSEWVIARLDTGGVARLTEYYIEDEQARGRTPLSLATYWRQFNSSGLQELVRTPIILLMALQVLPLLRQRQGENVPLSRLDIYREFIDQYIDLQRKKKLDSGREWRGLTTAALHYATALALTFFSEDKAVFSYQPPTRFAFARNKPNRWDAFFSPQVEDHELASIIPLRITAQKNPQEGGTITQYSFIHKSVLDYFTALGLLEALDPLIRDLQEQAPPEVDETSLSPSDWLTSQRQQAKQQRLRCHRSAWNARPINAEQAVIDFIRAHLAEAEQQWKKAQQNNRLLTRVEAETKLETKSDREVKDEKIVSLIWAEGDEALSPAEQFEQQLRLLMQASKRDSELQQASANAVTVLCRLGMNVFSDMDLSGVRWPGADLTGSYWDRVNLSHADLSHVGLRRVWMSQCNLSNTLLSGIQLGEWPSIQTKGGVHAIAVHPKNPQLMAIAGDIFPSVIFIYDRSLGRVISELTGHQSKGLITCLQYSPDGDQLAAGGDYRDLTVWLWDTQQGKLSHTLRGYKGNVIRFSYSPDGAQLAVTASRNNKDLENTTVQLWDPRQGKLIHELKEHSAGVTSLSYSPDSTQLASGSQDNTVRLWDTQQGKLTHTLTGHTGWITRLAYSPDGTQLASGSEDKIILLWNSRQGKLSHELKGHTASVGCLSYSSDGAQLASGTNSNADDIVRLWDPRQGKLIHELKGHTSWVTCLVYSPDNTQLASGSGDHTIRVWDTRQGKISHELKGHTDGVDYLSYSLDGIQLMSKSSDKTVRLWDTQQSKASHELTGHSGEITCLSCSPDGALLASGSWDKTTRLWDTRQGALIHELGHTDRVTYLAYSPSGAQFASGACTYLNKIVDTTVRLWNPRQGSLCHELKVEEKNIGLISGLNYSPDGAQLAVGIGCYLWLWDPEQGKISHKLGLRGQLRCLIYSPDSAQLALGTWEKTVCLWDPRQGKLIHELKGHTGAVNCLSYSPDGTQLASGSDRDDTIVRLWDTRQGKLSHELKDSGLLICLSYSPDGAQLASGGYGVLRLWDPRQGKLVHELKDSGRVNCLAYTSDSAQLASGSEDGFVRLWDPKTGQLLQAWHFTDSIGALLWRRETLFVASGPLISALSRNPEGTLVLKWAKSGSLPALDMYDSDFTDAQGLSTSQALVLEQRGGKQVPKDLKATPTVKLSKKFAVFQGMLTRLDGYAFTIQRSGRETLQIQFTAAKTVLAGTEEIREELAGLAQLLRQALQESGISLKSSAFKVDWEAWKLTIQASAKILDKIGALLQEAGLPYTFLAKTKGAFFSQKAMASTSREEEKAPQLVSCLIQ